MSIRLKPGNNFYNSIKKALPLLVFGFSLLANSAESEQGNEAYYKALSSINKDELREESIRLLEDWLGDTEEISTVNEFKAKSILALAKLEISGFEADVENHLEETLCFSLSSEETDLLGLYCEGKSNKSNFAPLEKQILASILVSYGNFSWHDAMHIEGINAFKMAANYAAEAHGNKASQSHGLKTDNMALRGGTDSILAIESMKSDLTQKAIAGKLNTQNIEAEIDPQQFAKASQIAAMSQVMNQMCQLPLNEEQKKAMLKKMTDKNPQMAAMLDLDFSQCESTTQKTQLSAKEQRKIGKAVAREAKTFQLLADNAMCPRTKTFSVNNYEEGIEFTQQHLGAAFDLLRGRRTQDLSIAQIEVMDALEDFIQTLSKIKGQYGTDFLSNLKKRTANDGSLFVDDVADCIQSLNIASHFRNAILISLNRRDRDNAYIERATNLLSSLNALSNKHDKTDILPLLMEKRALAESQISSGQLEKARQTLESLFATLPQTKSNSMHINRRIAPFYYLRGLELYAETGAQATEDKLISHLNDFNNAFNFEPGIARIALHMQPNEVKQLVAQEQNQFISNSLGNVDSQLQDAAKLMKNIDPEMGEIFEKKLGVFNSAMSSPDKMNEMMKTLQEQARNTPGADLDNPLLSHSVDFNSNTMLGDMMGSPLEMWRNKINDARLAELFISSALLSASRLSEAEQWLGAEGASQNLNIYRPEVNGFENFVRARLASANGTQNKASAYYQQAITDWYFNPRSVESLTIPFNQSASWLLEEAIKHEHNQGNKEALFNYIELARTVRFDNPELYGHLNPNQLKTYQAYLEQSHKELVDSAKIKAKKQGLSEFFEEQLAKGNLAIQHSARKSQSPVMPLSNGLTEIFDWLTSEEVHSWMWHYERFNALYSRKKINQKRDRPTQISKNKPISKSDLLTHIDYQVSGAILQDGFESHAYRPLRKIQTDLDKDTFVLSVMQFRNDIYSFGLTHSNLEHKKPNYKKVVETALQFQSAPSEETGKSLYQLLLAPHEAQLKQNLAFVVNGPLQNVAFAAIHNGEFYLVDNYRVRHSPSIAWLSNTKSSKNATEPTVFIAEAAKVPGQRPLEQAQKEISSIKSQFKTSIVGGNKLNRSQFLDAASKHKLVHFAGHSELNKDFPDISALLFYEGSLEARDIARLNFRNIDLLVLSSCSSAENSTMLVNNEFSAINAAFMQSGTGAVVASLKKVEDDITSYLMAKFYENLARGLRKDEALRLAQIYIRDNYPEAKHSWSSFILSGNPEPVKNI